MTVVRKYVELVSIVRFRENRKLKKRRDDKNIFCTEGLGTVRCRNSYAARMLLIAHSAFRPHIGQKITEPPVT